MPTGDQSRCRRNSEDFGGSQIPSGGKNMPGCGLRNGTCGCWGAKTTTCLKWIWKVLKGQRDVCVCDDIDNIGRLSVAIRIGYPFISAKVVWVYKLRKNVLYIGVKRDPDTHFAVKVLSCFPRHMPSQVAELPPWDSFSQMKLEIPRLLELDDGNIMEHLYTGYMWVISDQFSVGEHLKKPV